MARNGGTTHRQRTWYEAQIDLAERADGFLWECSDGKKLPEDVTDETDVGSFLHAVCDLLRLEELEDCGQEVSDEQAAEVLDRLRQAIDRFPSWPEAWHYRLVAPLVESLEELGLGWIALELVHGLPADEPGSGIAWKEIAEPSRRLMPPFVRVLIEEGTPAHEMESLVDPMRALSHAEPDDEELRKTFERLLLYTAMIGRQEVLLEHRRRWVSQEPLPQPLVEAVGQLRGVLHDSDLIGCAAHLLVSDMLAAGMLPDGVPAKQAVAAAAAYLIGRDSEEEPSYPDLARWAGTNAVKIRKLAKRVAAVADWQPDDEPTGVRQVRRWLTESLTPIDLPARWTPFPDQARPPYSDEAARRRLVELREVAWRMVDPAEALRFVADAFTFGGAAPDEMNHQIALEVITIWRDLRELDVTAIDVDGDEDEWDAADEDDLEDDLDWEIEDDSTDRGPGQ